MPSEAIKDSYVKVPAVTLGFWIIKVAATTLGETAGDAVTMSMNLGYLIGTVIFGAILAGAISAQVATKQFHPVLYWVVIVATTTAGTTLADYVDRSLGIGYLGGSLVLLSLVVISLSLWKLVVGSVSTDNIVSSQTELFYWTTIMFSQTLGTALGDWVADSGLGYSGGALVFGTALLLVTSLYFLSSTSRVILFWIAFILTRPLGATVGDFLDKPLQNGGLALSRYAASAALAIFIAACIALLPQRAGRHPA